MSRIVVLDFSEYECKIVEADSGKGGRPSTRFVGIVPLTKPDDADVRIAERSQAIRDFLKSRRVSTRRATIVVPKNFVMVRTAQLPSHVDDEIAGMARFEAERHIPFNAERHVVSYHVLARQGVKGSDVLLAAIDGPIAKEYITIATRAGLTVTTVSVSSIAAFNALAATVPAAMADGTTMLINIGRSACDLVIATNGVVTFTRGAAVGVDKLLGAVNEHRPDSPVTLADLQAMDCLEPQYFFDPGAKKKAAASEPVIDYDALPSGEEEAGNVSSPQGPAPSDAVTPDNPAAVAFTGWLNKVLQEARRTYEFAYREFNCPMVEKIYLSGEAAALGNLSRFFTTNFGVECLLFDPLEAGNTSAKVAKNLPGIPQAFATAIGGAVEKVPHSIHIDLSPPEYAEAANSKRQQRGFIITGTLVLIALVLGYLYLMDMFSFKRAQLDDYVTQNKKDKARVEELNAKRERLRIIRENVQDERGALDVLEKLSSTKVIPDKATLTSFEYKRGNYVKVEGDAKDLSTANQIVSDLKATGYFADSRLDNTVPNKLLRGRPPIPVLGWSATWTFPKPEKKKSGRSGSSESHHEEME